jgi:hypothetical protein
MECAEAKGTINCNLFSSNLTDNSFEELKDQRAEQFLSS